MNVWTITGNLGKDSEVQATPSGTTICRFSVAVKSGYGQNEKTTWVMCALFGKRADGALPDYLKKGTQVCISGEAYLDEWQGQDGTQQKMLKLNVDKLDLIGGRPETQQQTPRANPQRQQANPQSSQAANLCSGCGYPANNCNCDIPF